MADNPAHASVLICPKGEKFGTISAERFEEITGESSYIYTKVTPKIYANWVFNIKTLTEVATRTTTYKKPSPGSDSSVIPPPETNTRTFFGILSQVSGYIPPGITLFKEVSGYPPRNSFNSNKTSFYYTGCPYFGGPSSLGGGFQIRVTLDGVIYDRALLTNFTSFIYQDNFYIAIDIGYATKEEYKFTTVTDTVIATNFYRTSNEYANTNIDTTYTITGVHF